MGVKVYERLAIAKSRMEMLRVNDLFSRVGLCETVGRPGVATPDSPRDDRNFALWHVTTSLDALLDAPELAGRLSALGARLARLAAEAEALVSALDGLTESELEHRTRALAGALNRLAGHLEAAGCRSLAERLRSFVSAIRTEPPVAVRSTPHLATSSPGHLVAASPRPAHAPPPYHRALLNGRSVFGVAA